jgi:hypothetical protein
VSARARHEPWFRQPRERYAAALAEADAAADYLEPPDGWWVIAGGTMFTVLKSRAEVLEWARSAP